MARKPTPQPASFSEEDLDVEMVGLEDAPVDPAPPMKSLPGKPAKEEEGTMEVKLRGPASKVREQLSLRTSDEEEVSPVSTGTDDSYETLIEALRDPNNVVIVKRITPRTYDGQKINLEIYRQECPMTLPDIEEEIFTNHGGKKYRVAVASSKTGELVAAHVISTDADPIIEDTSEQDGKMRDFFMAPHQPPKKGPAELTVEALEKETTMAIKQGELESARARLEEMRGRNGKRPGADAEQAPLLKRIEEMERSNIELRYQSQIDALQRDIQALRAAPPAHAGPDMQKMLLDFMQKSDERFAKLIESNREQKLDAVMVELRALKNAPVQQGNSLKESVETLKTIADTLGWRVPGSDDDDDDDKDPKEWYEVLIDKHLPRVLDLFEDRKKEGKAMSKEELVAEFNRAADAASVEAVARIRQQPAVPAIPMAPRPPNAAVPVPTVSVPNPQAASVAVPPPAVVPPAPIPAPTAPSMPTSVEDEIKLRVGQCLTVLDREMTLRPREFNWNFVMWNALPEDLRERVCAAESPTAMISVFSDIVRPEGIAMLTAKLSDPKLDAWVRRGVAELAEWSEQLKADPEFDPADTDTDDDNGGGDGADPDPK